MAFQAMSDDELSGKAKWENLVLWGDQVKPADLDIIANGLFLRNNLNLLYGKQGLGKSTLATWLANEIGGRVLWLAVEEDPATTADRLEAAGGKRENICFLPREDSLWPSFELEREPEEFQGFVRALKPSLIIFDPATRFMGREVDDNQDRSVRGALETLSRIAIADEVTIVIIRHENKYGTGIDQVMGSTAWSAVPRCATRLYAEKGVLYAERVKCNQAPPLPRMPAHLVSVTEAVARFELLSGEAAALAMGTTTPEAVGAAALELLGTDDCLAAAEARKVLPGKLGVAWPAVLAHLGPSNFSRDEHGKRIRVYRRDHLQRIAAGQDLSGIHQDFEDCTVCSAPHAPWIDCDGKS